MSPPTARPSRWALPVTAGAGFLSGLDTTAVNLALPDIQRDLSASLGELQWVVNAFALLSAALLVTAGGLSDRFGRRRVFTAGLAAFAATSALCALAPTALVLDLARAGQGAAAACVTASGLAVLASLYPGPARGRALGTYSAIAALSFVVGPLVGGALTQGAGWRSVFWINVPIAVLLTLAARFALPALHDRVARPRFDYAGVATFTVGLGGILFAIQQGGEAGWSSAPVILSGVGGLVALIGFVTIERRTTAGIIDLTLFSDRTFSGAIAAFGLGGAAYFGMLVYLSLFLQQTQHYGAVRTGLVYLPTIAPYIVASPLAGRLLARVPGAPLPTIGLTLIAAGMVLLARVGPDAGLVDVALGMAVAGVGTGCTVTPLTAIALGRVPAERSGMASGVVQTFRPVGVTAGVSGLGLFVAGPIDAAAFSTVSWAAAGIAAVGAIVVAATVRATPSTSEPPAADATATDAPTSGARRQSSWPTRS